MACSVFLGKQGSELNFASQYNGEQSTNQQFKNLFNPTRESSYLKDYRIKEMKIFLILFIMISLSGAKYTLKYVQSISRHGARTTSYPEINLFDN